MPNINIDSRRIDKNFCMSSYLVFRYIIDNNVDFFNHIRHHVVSPIQSGKIFSVKTAKDIDIALQEQFANIKNRKLGLLLSGGMDSACLASYMEGCNAYTFRFCNGNYQTDELCRAEEYAKIYNLKLHYIDINWDTVIMHIDNLMKNKGAPVHSIEPQIMHAALNAKKDDIEIMIIGDAADYIFGGFDKLLAKDWTYDEFKERFTYVDPFEVLISPVDMDFAFEKYRKGNYIDIISLMHEYTDIESYSSYDNAFQTAGMLYVDPYKNLKMSEPLDIMRIRNGESKYLIRELFKSKYPYLPVPQKIPMPRPVDEYFKYWKGPTRNEFKQDISITRYSGNQKWLLWCLERFLNSITVRETI